PPRWASSPAASPSRRRRGRGWVSPAGRRARRRTPWRCWCRAKEPDAPGRSLTLVFESVHQFADWLQALPPAWIYATLFAIAYGENVVPPLPGDVAVVIGGSLVGLGLIGFAPLVGVATLGGALGFLTMYALEIGRAHV